MPGKMTSIAIYSRLILIAYQFGCNKLIPDHNPIVFQSPVENKTNTYADKIVGSFLGGLRHWDGEYFMHIAEFGYTYENTLAFYPLYPILVGIISRLISPMVFFLSMRNSCLLVAVVLNIWLFSKSTNILYKLTLRISNNPSKSWYTAVLFCINPATIFFVAAYSESLFMTLTLYLIMECINDLRTTRLLFFLSLSILTRSNGILNIGFVVYYLMQEIIYNSRNRFKNILKIVLIPILAVIPLALFNFFIYRSYCISRYTWLHRHPQIIKHHAQEEGYILSGNRLDGNSLWCDYKIPYFYSYIQSKYWNVGFLKYYQWQQIPNFLLAAPILFFMIGRCWDYTQIFLSSLLRSQIQIALRRYPLIPFALHCLFLSVFALLFVHIQVTTRLICSATPLIYWYASEYLCAKSGPLNFHSVGGYILAWFLLYVLIGMTMFSNNLPWT